MKEAKKANEQKINKLKQEKLELRERNSSLEKELEKKNEMIDEIESRANSYSELKLPITISEEDV